MQGHNQLILFAALALTGCASKPHPVSIDWAIVSNQDRVIVKAVRATAPHITAEITNQSARPETRLYSALSDQDIQGVLHTLQTSRTIAFERALQELRKQYQSSIDAAVTDAQSVIREADQEDWNETSQKLRALLEQYAPNEGALRMRLVALREGLTPVEQSITLSDNLRSSLQIPIREKVKITQKELDDWLKQFDGEITNELVAYRGRRQNRLEGVEGLTDELKAKYEKDAQRQAKEIVDTSLRSQTAFDLILTQRLGAVNSATVKSSGLNAQPVSMSGSRTSAPTDLLFEAKLYTETHNLVLKKGARDVTKEFIEWRKNRAIGH